MPLLALFSKKNKASSKASAVAYSQSNVSLSDDGYVSVVAPSPVSYHAQLPASSSKLALPFRRKREHEQQPSLNDSDPLLEPPPRRSSLFQTLDDPLAHRSTQSLPTVPNEAEHRLPRPQIYPHQQDNASQSTGSAKKSMFNWSSNKDRGKSASSTKSGVLDASDATFNLKSFRHVRPESPALPSSDRSPSPSPALVPIPTSTIPSPPVSFQVTSRRPRGNSEVTISGSPPAAASQQKIPVGAFRQAARRSTTSLADSPLLSPSTSLDDRPPPSLLLHVQPGTSTPPRPPRPQPPLASSVDTPRPNASPLTHPKPVISLLPSKPTGAPGSAPRKRTNAFSMSSSSSSSEEEEEESDSSGDGTPRISRKGTIKQSQSQGDPTVLPPINTPVRGRIQRSTPPSVPSSTSLTPPFPSATTAGVPRAQSSLGLYGPGSRPRASLSMGALTPTAKEARASVTAAANARLTNTIIHGTPKGKSRSFVRNPGSDTSESEESASDSDEDAPLSTLAPPQRPGTSMSSHSSPGGVRRTLVDLDAPSTLTGRPARAPPPLDRETESRQKPKVNVEASARPNLAPATKPQTFKASQSPPSQHLPQSQGPQPLNSRASSSRTVATLNTSTTPSFSGSSGRFSSSSPSSGDGGRHSTAGTSPNMSTVSPPLRPFARRESPASSTGDSSSGKAPLTPRDGSSTYSGPSAVNTNRRPGTHGRKPSITFEDEQDGNGKEKQNDTNADEARRKERRRSEARAAIELGNVVNGPPPVDDEDEVALGQQQGIHGGWPQPNMQFPMQIPMPPMPPMFPMGMGMQSPGAYGFNYPPHAPTADPAFLAAHQQAMAIAKQTFQYAVAQQALAAANEEWERNSTMTGYGGPAPTPHWGYGMGMRQSGMFTPSPRSMYAGSVSGGGGGWGGTGSAYGNSFGPVAAGGRNSIYSQGDRAVPVQRPARPRTKTAPSATSPPNGTLISRIPAPPSSFRGTGR